MKDRETRRLMHLHYRALGGHDRGPFRVQQGGHSCSHKYYVVDAMGRLVVSGCPRIEAEHLAAALNLAERHIAEARREQTT
jgi:hypothetical protein